MVTWIEAVTARAGPSTSGGSPTRGRRPKAFVGKSLASSRSGACAITLGGVGVVLRESRGDDGGNDPAAALAGMGEQRCADGKCTRQPLPSPACITLATAAFMPVVGVGDDELDAVQTAPPQLARRKSVQKVSASEGPMSMPSTSRLPSLLTPIATITRDTDVRPFWRTLT